MNASDLYLKIIDKTGKSHIAMLRAWDKTALLASQQTQHAKEGGRVEMATQADYDAQIRARRAA